MSDSDQSTCPQCGRPIPPGEDGACPACGWSSATERTGLPARVDMRKIMFRDLLIFQLKLLLDGVKDIFLAPLSIVAFLWDLIPSRRRRDGRTFYAVIRAGEKFDTWLSLYDATERADARTDGLFGESLAGANNLIGKVEELVRKGVEVGTDTVSQARERRDEARRRQTPPGQDPS